MASKSHRWLRRTLAGALVIVPIAVSAAAAADRPEADLAVTIGEPSGAVVGTLVGVPLRVENLGDRHAKDVRLAVRLPGGWTDLRGPAACGLDDGVVTCRLGRVDRGEAKSLVLAGTPTSAGSAEVDARVTSATADPSPGNDEDRRTIVVAAGAAEPPPDPTPDPTEEPTPDPTAQPKPTATPKPKPTATPQATASPKPKPTATPKPKPTATPQPKPTTKPKPTATPAPSGGGSTGSGTFASPAAPAPVPSGGESPGTSPSQPQLLSPAPVVRIVGRLTLTGARVTRLTVTTPPGTRITVRCKGRGCPFARRTKAVRASRRAAVVVRLRFAERSYRAGAGLEVAVGRRGAIGKFTGFVIRRGKAPRRTDACVAPGSSRRMPCPTA